MSSRIALPLEAQANRLMHFLQRGGSELNFSAAVKICGELRTSNSHRARVLKARLSSSGVNISHHACLDAVAQIDGYESHVARPARMTMLSCQDLNNSRPLFDISPCCFPKTSAAASYLCKTIFERYFGAGVKLYGCIEGARGRLQLTLSANGTHQHQLKLGGQIGDGSEVSLSTDEVVKTVERLRRAIEGQLHGWLDGCIAINDAGTLQLYRHSFFVAEGLESHLVSSLENDIGATEFPPDMQLALGGGNPPYRLLALGHELDAPTPLERDSTEKLLRRAEAFYRFHGHLLGEFVRPDDERETPSLPGFDVVPPGDIKERDSNNAQPYIQNKLMGTKMLWARDARGNAISTTQRAAGVGVEPLSCTDCGVGVSFVPAHPRERDGKPYMVNAYFRLKPNTEHQDGCQYAVEKTIAAIAARPDSLIETLNQVIPLFRLLTIDREPDDVTNPKPAPGKERKPPSGSDVEYEEPKNRRLAAYLSTAKRILKLRAACENDASIKDHLKLVYSGETVFWSDFYYETERFLAAYRWVGNTARSFPIALVGLVRNVREVPTVNGKLYVLNLKSARATPLGEDSSIGETGEASIWSKEPAWLERFKPNDEILAYGHWKQAKTQKPVRAPTSPASFRGYLNRELSMWLLFPAQIAKLSEVD